MPAKKLAFITISIFTILTLSIASLITLKPKNVLGISDQPVPLAEELDYWNDIATKNPTYLDAWLKLAYIYYQLNDHEAAKISLTQAKLINPNSQKIIILESRLGL